jgi:signal transduction histidine kinase
MDAPQTSIYDAIIITSIIIGIIIIFFIISIIRQQRKILDLNRQNIIAEITALEKERSRIAADLHDEVGPLLSTIRININSFELSDTDDKIQMVKTNKHLDDTLKRIREISFDLMPYSLLRLGIITALKEFVDYLNRNIKIKFIFKGQKDLTLSEEKAIHIYRMVQEMIHNTIKHAKATEVNIVLKTEKKNLILTFSDNGIGFDHEKEAEENTGFGIKSLHRRTELLQGKMYLDSVLGKGTEYSFEIPF